MKILLNFPFPVTAADSIDNELFRDLESHTAPFIQITWSLFSDNSTLINEVKKIQEKKSQGLHKITDQSLAMPGNQRI